MDCAPYQAGVLIKGFRVTLPFLDCDCEIQKISS